jgi:hypothetical protein
MTAITLLQWRNISVPFALVCVGTAEKPPNYHNERKVLKEFNLFSKKEVPQRFT